jgi:membrane-bound lytic murein transglycosylase F
MIDDSGKPGGLEHDLIEAFALELGVGVKYTVVPPAEIEPRMAAGEAHIATAWLNTPEGIDQKATPPILQKATIFWFSMKPRCQFLKMMNCRAKQFTP